MISYLIILLGLALIIADLFLAGIFYPIGIGIVVAGLIYMVYPSDILAISSGILTTVLTYYLTIKLVKSNYEKLKFTTEDVIGLKHKKGKVIKILKNGYLVEIDGQEWSARSDYTLKEGDYVEVLDEGVMLKVKPL